MPAPGLAGTAVAAASFVPTPVDSDAHVGLLEYAFPPSPTANTFCASATPTPFRFLLSAGVACCAHAAPLNIRIVSRLPPAAPGAFPTAHTCEESVPSTANRS